ncbi:MAG: pilus assembly protein [Actinobacteria bacterium]|nr:pilus assembly protein [Actinomycetota bacterium]
MREAGGPIGRERGSTTLELTIIVPALLLVMASIFQAGLWFFAREVVLAAAEEGARAAAVEDGDAGAGTQKAREFVDRTASNLVDNVSVSSRRTTTRATVTVSGRSLSLIPGVDGFTITQTATFPVERIT